MLTLKGAKRQTTKVAFAPDGRTLAVTGDTPGGVELWGLPAGTGPDRWLADSDWSAVPQFTPDGKTLYVSCRTHHLTGRVLATGAPVPPPPGQGLLGSFVLSADAKWLTAVRHIPFTRDGGVFVERVGFARSKTGTLTEKWATRLDSGTVSFAVAALPGGRGVYLEYLRVRGNAPRRILMLIVVTQSTGQVIVRGQALSLEVQFPPVASPGGEWLVGVARYRLQVFDASTLLMVAELSNPEGKKQFTGAAFTPDGKHLLAAGTTGYVRAFAVGRWVEVKAWDWKAGPLTCVGVSPDGTLAACGTKTGTVVVWDLDL